MGGRSTRRTPGPLVAQALVEKRRDRDDHVTLVPSRPTGTVQLLDEITPSTSDRLLDRFTKLVDDPLAE